MPGALSVSPAWAAKQNWPWPRDVPGAIALATITRRKTRRRQTRLERKSATRQSRERKGLAARPRLVMRKSKRVSGSDLAGAGRDPDRVARGQSPAHTLLSARTQGGRGGGSERLPPSVYLSGRSRDAPPGGQRVAGAPASGGPQPAAGARADRSAAAWAWLPSRGAAARAQGAGRDTFRARPPAG